MERQTHKEINIYIDEVNNAVTLQNHRNWDQICKCIQRKGDRTGQERGGRIEGVMANILVASVPPSLLLVVLEPYKFLR